MYTKTVDETEIPVVDLILEAYNQADVGKYAEALAKIKAAKSVDARNIYIIALEKQFAKLLSLPAGAGVDELRETLPGLLDRALDSARKNHGGSGNAAQSNADAGVKEEKEARLKEVRDQFFSRADEFVERGDYESALAEVKRVAIIDPNNRIAREYLEKISQLAGGMSHAIAPTQSAASSGTQPGVSPKETIHPSAERQSNTPATKQVQHQDEFSAPAPPKTGKPKTVALIAVIAVVMLGLGAAYFLTRAPGHAGSRLVYSLGDAQKTQLPEHQSGQLEPQQEPTPTTTSESGSVANNEAPDTPPESVSKSPAKEEKHSTAKPSTASESKPEPKKEPVKKPEVQTPAQAAVSTPVPATSEPDPNPPAQPFVAVEKEPKIVKLQKPELPEVATRAGLTGRVVVKVQIDPKGKPTQAVILTSTNHVFDDAVVAAVMKSKFEPGMMSSGPVSTWMSIPFVFK